MPPSHFAHGHVDMEGQAMKMTGIHCRQLHVLHERPDGRYLEGCSAACYPSKRKLGDAALAVSLLTGLVSHRCDHTVHSVHGCAEDVSYDPIQPGSNTKVIQKSPYPVVSGRVGEYLHSEPVEECRLQDTGCSSLGWTATKTVQ